MMYNLYELRNEHMIEFTQKRQCHQKRYTLMAELNWLQMMNKQ